MLDIAVELADLQRRAYGADGGGLSPAERARLAQLEDPRRVLDPPAAVRGDVAIPLRPPAPSAGSRGSTETPRLPVSAPADPVVPDEAPRGRGRGTWFRSALVITAGVASVIVMVAAGAIGWGGGYAAGLARSGGLGNEARLVAELRPTDAPEDFFESGLGYDAVGSEDPTEGMTYYGGMGENTHVVVVRPHEMTDTFTDLPRETACLQIMQLGREIDQSMNYYVGSACGTPRLTLSADVYVGTGEDGSWIGSALTLDAYDEGTLLRFTFNSAMNQVQVWTLPPAPIID